MRRILVGLLPADVSAAIVVRRLRGLAPTDDLLTLRETLPEAGSPSHLWM